MKTIKQYFIVALSLSITLVSNGQTIAEKVKDLKLANMENDELFDYVLRDKLDNILPVIMKNHNIDMWIHVSRYGDQDPLAAVFGEEEGVYVFTDIRGDRIERAYFGFNTEFIDKTRAFDILRKQEMKTPLTVAPENRMNLNDFYRTGNREWPGREVTELDFRFKGLKEFVEERDPKVIAVNYLEEMGEALFYETPKIRPDGISYTDYRIMAKKLGEKYSSRIISSEYLEFDFMSKPVLSEFEIYTRIRSGIDKKYRTLLKNIVRSKTTLEDLGYEVSAIDKYGKRQRSDYVLQGGELLIICDGAQSGGFLYPEWEYRNYHDVVDMYAYYLEEDEDDAPPHIKRVWSEALRIRKIIENNLSIGKTAGENYELLKKKFTEAGLVHQDIQDFSSPENRDKTRVSIDMHAAGSGLYAPRIGPLGPDWQRDIVLPLYHHFYFEYFFSVDVPEWGNRRSISLRFHDGAVLTENGVEYFFRPQTELILAK